MQDLQEKLHGQVGKGMSEVGLIGAAADGKES